MFLHYNTIGFCFLTFALSGQRMCLEFHNLAQRIALKIVETFNYTNRNCARHFNACGYICTGKNVLIFVHCVQTIRVYYRVCVFELLHLRTYLSVWVWEFFS